MCRNKLKHVFQHNHLPLLYRYKNKKPRGRSAARLNIICGFYQTTFTNPDLVISSSRVMSAALCLIALAKSRVTRSLTTEECQQYLHVEACPAEP
jgi:hypothetical protein